MSQRARFAPDELAIAALFWTDGSFEDHVRRWMPQNRQLCQEILWGSPTDQDTPHVRTGAAGKTPEEIRASRKFVPGELSRASVLEALPGAHEAAPFRGFAHTEAAFRDWHIATHLVSARSLAATARSVEGIDWAYIVSATGQHRHTHALVSFRFVHPQDFVRSVLRLPEEAKLTPTHSDFGAAKEYLDNQATATIEIGDRPKRRIYRDGNKAAIDERPTALEAIGTGETTAVLRNGPSRPKPTPAETRARERWMANAARSPRTHHETEAASKAEAREAARAKAADYSGRFFEINFDSILPGTVFKDTPDWWFGEEVVLFINLPRNLASSQLSARWLRSVPEVVYTTKPEKKIE